MILLEATVWGCFCVAAVYYLFSLVGGMRFAFRAAAPAPPLPDPPPSALVLKPLYPAGHHVEENLASFAAIDYSNFAIRCGIDDPGDAAASVVARLAANHTYPPITAAVGMEATANRKVGKLLTMMRDAPQADALVLSDADIRVEPDYLRRIMGELYSHPRIGLITSLYRGLPVTNEIGSRLESLFVNTDFAPMALVSHMFEPMRHAFGATLAIRREVYEMAGGFGAVKDLLADDFMLGRIISENGFSIKLSSALVTIVPDEHCFRDFWRHQLRWARTYRTVRPESVALIFTHGMFWALVLTVISHFSPISLAALAGMMALRLGSAAFMLQFVLRLPNLLRDLWLLPIKDLAMTAVYFASLLGNSVHWGGRRFRILPGGRLQLIKG